MSAQELLAIELLTVEFQARSMDKTMAVDGLNLTVERGQIAALVGESGSGKSASALAIMRLLPRYPASHVSGTIWFEGSDLLQLSAKNMRRVRGRSIAMIFQEPMTCLNPVLTVGNQITESIQQHKRRTAAQARHEAIELLDQVRLDDPAQRYRQYPHELSGGMRQRVMIAMALAHKPSLLIADEPTTALDVTTQAQILELLCSLCTEQRLAILLITHDLGIVAEVADEVFVIHKGRIVEHAGVFELFARPEHPYTRELFSAVSRLRVLSGSDPPRSQREQL